MPYNGGKLTFYSTVAPSELTLRVRRRWTRSGFSQAPPSPVASSSPPFTTPYRSSSSARGRGRSISPNRSVLPDTKASLEHHIANTTCSGEERKAMYEIHAHTCARVRGDGHQTSKILKLSTTMEALAKCHIFPTRRSETKAT